MYTNEKEYEHVAWKQFEKSGCVGAYLLYRAISAANSGKARDTSEQ